MDDRLDVIESHDSIFDVEADMIVNPVNCKGISGKGLALEFKHKFPVCQAKYEEICRREIFINDPTGTRRKVPAFRPGDILHFIEISRDRIPKNISEMSPEEIDGLLNKRQHIVYLPTKNHWKNPSKYEYVRSGLKSLRQLLDKEGLEGVQTIAIPALGCGLGGLKWDEVKKIILEELGDSGKTLILFPPK